MLNNTSIQEIPSIEEVSPAKPRHPMKHHLEIDSKILSRLSVDSGRDSPELKRCSILCPKDQPNAFTLESRIDKILKKTNRTINEAVLLYKNIKNFDFFRKFKAEHHKELCTTEALLHLCKSMKFETFFPGTIIYRKDEDSNQKIYLVFSGRVATATEAQEYATKESQQNKYRSVNNLGEEDDELNPSFKKDSRLTKTYKKLIPQKTTSKGSDGSPKHSPGMKRTESKKDSTGMQKSKAKNSTRMSAGEMTDKELAEWRAKCTLETLVDRKITKQSSTISPREPNSNGLNREGSVPSKVMETLATTETSIKKATRSNTIAFFGTRRSASSRNMTDKMLHSPFNGERGIPSDFQTVLKLVPQITHLGSIGEGRFVGDAEPQEYPGYSQAMDNVAGTLETSLYKEDNKNLFTSNPSKEKITEDPEDLLGKEDLSESMDSIESDSIQEVQEGRDEPGKTKKKYGIRKGGTFGDEVLKLHGERKETMLATVFTQVLTFTVHDYDYITTRFEKTNTKRLNFLLDHVPGLEKAIKYDKIKNVEVHFQELDFSLHNHVVREGEKGKNIYIIVDGMCKVFKEPVDPLNQSQNLDSRPSMSNLDTPRKKMEGAADKILMCLIQPGAFIGEEILFQDSKLYQYTVKAASANVKVIAIKKSTFMRIMPQDVISSLKDLHMTRYEHKKIIFANKLKMSTTLAVPQRNTLLKRFSSISISKDLASSFSKSKLGQREQDSSIYDSWTAQETPRNMTLSAEPNKAPSIVTSKTLTLNIPRSQRTLSYVSQDEVSTQDKELSRTPRRYLTSSYPAAVAGKTWDTYTKLQPLEFSRGNSKDSGSPERTMMGSMQKLKTTFTKFGHMSTLEVPSLVDVSMKAPNEVLPKPSPKARPNLRATAMSFNTSISQLPKIDPTDIEGLRFDFGEKQKEKEVKKNVEFSKKTGKCISLQNSREASPRNVVPLICMVSPKNVNYLFKHTRAKSGAGTVITPKALLESCKELKEEMQARSIKKKKAQAFVFPAVMNPSPIPMKTPKSEQNSFLDRTESKNSSPIKNMSPVSNDPLRSAIKNRANRLILKAGVLGRGFGGSRNPAEGKQSVEP